MDDWKTLFWLLFWCAVPIALLVLLAWLHGGPVNGTYTEVP